jgi:hypothetical protein
MTNGYRIARRLVAPALILLVATSASAEPIQYALVNATFNDGGIATGYLVLDSPSDPLLSPTVTDWAITVSGGNPNIPRFAYDPTSSTVEVLGGDPGAIVFHSTQMFPPSCGGVLRRLQIGVLSFDAASETCAVERSFVTGSFQQVPGPLITVKASNQHPAGRTVFGGFLRFSLDVSPAGSTADLDWYWAIVWEGSVYWVTPAGISSTPASLGRGPAVAVNNKTLFLWSLGGTMISTWFFAVNGSSIVAIDHMTGVVPPSP